MNKLFILSLFALTAGLYADHYGNPYQGNFQQRGMGFQQGNSGQPACMAQGRHSSMPYTTIVNEDQQGPRQQYYYYGADNQRDEDYDDEEDNTYYNINRDNLRQNIRERTSNVNRDDLRQNIRDRAQNFRGSLQERGLTQDRAQNTYFNRSAQTTAASDTFTSDSDRALGQRIRDAIKGGWFSRGYEQVSLDVNNGIVTLRGFVVSLDDKKKVEDAVKNVNGVNNVRNQLSIANQDRATNGSQTTSADNRTLMNRNQTTQSEDDDEDEDDEDDNDNDYPQDRASSAADRQINSRIRDAIGNGWFAKKYEAIVIRTDQGIVTIEGFVDTFDDQRKLNDEIRKIAGVRSVNNNVQVKDKSS